MNALHGFLSSLIHWHQERALNAQMLLSNLDKGEIVDAAGSTRGACWTCGGAVGL